MSLPLTQMKSCFFVALLLTKQTVLLWLFFPEVLLIISVCQKCIGQILAQSIETWREKTHANENSVVPPLADSLFHIPASHSSVPDSATSDSTMAIVARALDVLSSSRCCPRIHHVTPRGSTVTPELQRAIICKRCYPQLQV